MSKPKGGRGSRVVRPAGNDEWDFRYANKNAEKAWRELSNAKLSSALADFYDLVISDPRAVTNPSRHHQLKYDLATGNHQGRTLERWQYEITGAGRAWFLIDDAASTVWLEHIGEGHPARTDK